jgi:hypothetical protein
VALIRKQIPSEGHAKASIAELPHQSILGKIPDIPGVSILHPKSSTISTILTLLITTVWG